MWKPPPLHATAIAHFVQTSIVAYSSALNVLMQHVEGPDLAQQIVNDLLMFSLRPLYWHPGQCVLRSLQFELCRPCSFSFYCLGTLLRFDDVQRDDCLTEPFSS